MPDPIETREATHDLAMELYYPPGGEDDLPETTRTRSASEIAEAFVRIRQELQRIGYETVTGPDITEVS
jgi:hypothetical protein